VPARPARWHKAARAHWSVQQQQVGSFGPRVVQATPVASVGVVIAVALGKLLLTLLKQVFLVAVKSISWIIFNFSLKLFIVYASHPPNISVQVIFSKTLTHKISQENNLIILR
jgi:hypothetical protein